MTVMTTVPVRSSDAERDTTAFALGEHMALGRLDYEEFTLRLDDVFTARTTLELHAALVDLPRLATTRHSLPGELGVMTSEERAARRARRRFARRRTA
jgi:Domain of unknown function (DUF1707)